ncbi:flagellar protein FlaF [Alsobacter soli]|uniref:Flagellar protein FlaF n=1 Tax=Alsobacter soli TaxID=2109933 RepID=A0A2T1HUL7_9HYPH|nr:flagellar biosynthesis regulator FlaF [Alsobacter soli]PSC05219.1 flagellar protein FlaF [Alsobacter soli]
MSYAKPVQAYGQAAKAGLSGRDLEAAVLIQCAADLQRAAMSLETDPKSLDEALARNRKLWSILAAEATEPTNPLPQEVKANIARLALFVFNRSLDLLVKPTPEGVQPLVDINRNIAAGLRTRPGAA